MKPLTKKQEQDIRMFIELGEHDSEFVCRNVSELFKFVKLLYESRVIFQKDLERRIEILERDVLLSKKSPEVPS